MKEIIVPCDQCEGSGKMGLREALRETLEVIPKRGATAEELAHRITRVKINAQNNRLERLRSLDLVTRERDGIQWRYFRK